MTTLFLTLYSRNVQLIHWEADNDHVENDFVKELNPLFHSNVIIQRFVCEIAHFEVPLVNEVLESIIPIAHHDEKHLEAI